MRSLKARLALLVAAAVGTCIGVAAAAGAAPIAAFTTKGAWNFVSAPKLHPPRIHTDTPTKFKKLAPGDIFIANFKNLQLPQPMVGQSGPLILNDHMQPIWFKPIGVNQVALDLKLQTYNGKPALSWWQGVISSVGVNDNGTDFVVNQHYRQVASVTGQAGWDLSEHELVISGQTGWVTSYKPISMDLSPYGGAVNGTLLDASVQQYNLKTGALVGTWDALHHIPLSQSQTKPAPKPGVPWDAYHVNSVQLQPGGKFLVSMRNTWGAYLVDTNSSNLDASPIQWTVSGNPAISSFKLPTNGAFQWQHDVELHSGNVLSVFDDACCNVTATGFGPQSGTTRGLVLKLDTTNHTASFVAQYERPDTESAFLGNTDLLPNGNVMVGWGSQRFFSEYGKGGKLLLDAVMPTPDLSYRAFVQKWVGTPFFPPSGAVRRKHGKTTVYASWDGATQVAAWRVLAGPGVKHLTAIVVKAKTGFETAISLGSKSYKVYKVQALNARGKVLRTSGRFPKPGPSSPGFY